jgi:hypothetical protein
MKNSIHDGYTESGVIRGIPRLHNDLAFKWRPMTNEQLGDYAEAAGKVSGRRWKRLMATVLAGQLVEWSEKDDQGSQVDITPASVLRLKPRLFNRLFMVISGEDAPDEQPGKPDDELADEAGDLLRAVELGRPVQAIREERQRKNS